MTQPVTPKRYLTGPQICARYSISDMTLWRWLKNSDLGFPQPIYVNRRRLFDEAELLEWEAERSRVNTRAA
jgi:predicted DNA-binding transcriptional regulator AlpA